jgi:hypothetical protein
MMARNTTTEMAVERCDVKYGVERVASFGHVERILDAECNGYSGGATIQCLFFFQVEEK